MMSVKAWGKCYSYTLLIAFLERNLAVLKYKKKVKKIS